MTAPESRAPREGRTGEVRPKLVDVRCPDCDGVGFQSVGIGRKDRCRFCAGNGYLSAMIAPEGYQPPAPPSVGDATPEARCEGCGCVIDASYGGLCSNCRASQQRYAAEFSTPPAAPSAPPAALPPIPDGHPHAEALRDLATAVKYADREVDFLSASDSGAYHREVARAASLRTSYFALLASPSVVADAGAGDERIAGVSYRDYLAWVDERFSRLRKATGERSIEGALQAVERHASEVARLTSALDAATRRAEAEQARREFMQVYGRFLGWGFSHDDMEMRTPGVSFHAEGWASPYDRFTLFEPCGDGDVATANAAAEARVIDRAIEAERALAPSRAVPTEDRT